MDNNQIKKILIGASLTFITIGYFFMLNNHQMDIQQSIKIDVDKFYQRYKHIIENELLLENNKQIDYHRTQIINNHPININKRSAFVQFICTQAIMQEAYISIYGKIQTPYSAIQNSHKREIIINNDNIIIYFCSDIINLNYPTHPIKHICTTIIINIDKYDKINDITIYNQ